MGTVLEVTLCDQPPAASPQIVDSLFATATQLDAIFSTFSPDSAVSRLNAHTGHGALPAPPDLVALLQLSIHYWRLTQGAFDITIGPLITAWSEAGKSQVLPSHTILKKARAKIGSDKIALSRSDQVTLERTGMAIDLGGIAKGYTLDRLAHTLKDQGITNALLDFGQSSIWALGSPPDAPSWRLLIQRPNGESVGIIAVRNQALSISASFGQRFTIQGHQYGHIIDPRTGEPLTRDLLACVIAPDATQAEALSKALLILGEKEGMALLERLPGVAGLLSGADHQLWTTTTWKQATQFVPSSQDPAQRE
jgi:thiamine biosynthesis lipoprotein